MGSLYLVGRILLVITNLLILLLTIRIILSWFSLPYNKFSEYLRIVTDPILNLSRKIFPLTIGAIDLSIIFPLIVLAVAARIVDDTMISSVGHINIFYLFALMVSMIEMIFNFIIFIFIIFIVILIILEIVAPNSYNPMVYTLKSIINPFISFLDRIFNINYQSKKKTIIYYIIIGVFFILLGILLKIGFGFIIGFLNYLRFKL